MVSVTDGEVGECVDPGGNRAILNVGEGGEPGLPREEGNGQWRRLVVHDAGKLKGRARHNVKPTLCTEYVSYVQNVH
jgi:hypothetical protein